MRAEPWMNRTTSQSDANEFDADLYRLIARAERKAAASVPVERKKWEATVQMLRVARVPVREMMHREDVAQTW